MKRICLYCMALTAFVMFSQNIFSQCEATAQVLRNNLCSYDSLGQAVVHVSGGVQPLTYTWNTSPEQYDSILENVPAGTYTVTVTSGDSVCDTVSVTITAPPPISISVIADSTCGIYDSVVVSGGTPPYAYSWSDCNLCTGPPESGTYDLTVSDFYNCTASDSITIFPPTLITIADSMQDAACPNYANGSITALPSVSSAFYSWSTSPTQHTQTANYLTPGTYTVTVSQSYNCSASASFTVGATEPADSLTIINAYTCNNYVINGSACAYAFGGTPPYHYYWSNGQTGACLINLSPTTYTLTITDQAGCSVTDNANVALNPELSVSISTVNSICGESTGAAWAITTGGTTSQYQYTWNVYGNTDTLLNLATGEYQVTVTDNGCSATASALLHGTSLVNVMLDTSSISICTGDTATICVTDSLNFISYLWSNFTTGACLTTPNPGYYNVIATEQNGCTVQSDTVAVSVYPNPQITISAYGDTLVVYDFTNVQWYLDYTPIPGATQSTYVIQVMGAYSVSATDSYGCTVYGSICLVCGINNINIDSNISVFPNPLSVGNWQLAVGNEYIGSQVEILDVDGRVVYKFQITKPKSQIPAPVESGVHLLRITTGSGMVVRKLVKL